MKDKNYDKPQYTCGVCGTRYDSVQERSKCEMDCVKKIEEAEKKAAEEKKKAEKTARKTELDEAFANLLKLHDAYVKDYGPYEFEFSKENRTISIPCWESKLWNHFFF